MILPLHAIVTIDPVEPSSEGGFNGEVDFTFKASQGNTEKRDNDVGTKLQYDSKEFVNFLIFNYKEGYAQKVNVVNRSYGHFRHVHLLTDELAWELYSQLEQDKFKNLELRKLAGAGVRYRFFSSETDKFYYGIGVYYSEEYYKSVIAGDENRFIERLNSYISYKEKINGSFVATLTLYYQPSLRHPQNDTNIIADGSLSFKLTTALALKISGNYKKDTDPALGNKKEDSYYATSLSYTF
jgi:putative salt-induced outer membrane protein YdiY